MKPDDVIEVICSSCGAKRELKWSAYKKKRIGPPYVQRCGSCAQQEKKLTEETKKKISDSLTGVPKDQEMRDRLAEYRLAHPSDNLIPGAGGGWNKDLKTGPLSEETKKKISDSMKKRKEEENESD